MFAELKQNERGIAQSACTTEYNYGLNQNKLPRANAKIFVSSAITPHEQRIKLVET